MKKIVLLVLLLFSSSALAQEGCRSKIQGFVDNSGHQAIVATPCKVWLLPGLFTIPQGDGLQGLMLIGQEDDVVVMGTVVQAKAVQSLSRDKLVKLMQLNNDIDYVKTGIDKDGDLFVRTELRAASLTGDDFNTAIRYVIDGGNRAYAMLKK